MFTKMKESKGFTLVELMIVVAIIGILAAVAVPYYQRYVAKARLTAKVIPGVHAIETSLGTYYAVRGELPTDTDIGRFDNDSDTTCFTLSDLTLATTRVEFLVTIDSAPAGCEGLSQLDNADGMFTAFAVIASTGKLYWDYEGPLADELGL